jgi:hypothetical protein
MDYFRQYCRSHLANKIVWELSGGIMEALSITFSSHVNLVVGYTVSIVIGGLFIEMFMERIRNTSEVLKPERKSRKPDLMLVRILGGLERFVYTTFIITGYPAGIFAWMAFKVLTRWTNKQELEGWETISKSNIYLIGNLLTLIFGVLGGLMCMFLPKVS